MQVYHGSPYNFSNFTLSHVRSENGTSEGVGIYFTTSKQIAKGYAQNGYLYTVSLNEGKQLSFTDKTISQSTLKSIIKKLENNGIDILSNYGDIEYSGLSQVLNEATTNIYESCDNDVDILCELYNESGENKEVFQVFHQLGYTHYMINNPTWGQGKQKIVVVIDPSIIEIENIEKID